MGQECRGEALDGLRRDADPLRRAHAIETAGAVDRIAVARHEGDGGHFAALGADDFGLDVIGQTELDLADGSARRAARRQVDEAFFLVELLLAGRPGKGLFAFPASQRAVHEVHLTSSSVPRAAQIVPKAAPWAYPWEPSVVSPNTQGEMQTQ